MNPPIIQRRVIKSISEFSVFKIALIVYLVVFVITVIFAALSALIMQSVLPILGNSITSLLQTSGIGDLLTMFGINVPDIGAIIGSSGSIFSSGPVVIIVVALIIGGLLFSVIFAAVAAFWTWIFNVIIRISGGIEIRYIDRTKKAETQIQNNASNTGAEIKYTGSPVKAEAKIQNNPIVASTVAGRHIEKPANTEIKTPDSLPVDIVDEAAVEKAVNTEIKAPESPTAESINEAVPGETANTETTVPDNTTAGR